MGRPVGSYLYRIGRGCNAHAHCKLLAGNTKQNPCTKYREIVDEIEGDDDNNESVMSDGEPVSSSDSDSDD